MTTRQIDVEYGDYDTDNGGKMSAWSVIVDGEVYADGEGASYEDAKQKALLVAAEVRAKS